MEKKNKIILKSATELSKEEQERLLQALASHYAWDKDDCTYEYSVDNDLQNGFTIRVNNDFYDYSLSGKLKKLAQALFSSNKELDKISEEALREMLYGNNNPAAASLSNLFSNSGGQFRFDNGSDSPTKGQIEPNAKTYSTQSFAKESALFAKLLAHDDKEALDAETLNELDESFLSNSQELADVIRVGDGVAWVNGLKMCVNGELIIFDSGAIGMAMNLEEEKIGVILLNGEDTVKAGDSCRGSGQAMSVPCGLDFLGRVVDPLGRPIDFDKRISPDHYRPIEYPAPAIIDRQAVNEPLYTGITAIDAMIPIGRGQRELIIGDRQTGKSTIALDTILNQKGKNVYCIYVAIGQKISTIKSQVALLRERGALEYTTVVAAPAATSAALQYIAPYAACAMAEELMYERHSDVLVIYDDLTKHAQAYRAISLLLHRPPGREAYPGDVFYIHSRLLERAARLSASLGGGSITALPIVETQSGDISAYIPTNVISITDGQIYLESDLFFAGQRPAINVGLSVSRVGGSAQKTAMRKAAGPLRISMAQFRELQAFSQLSGEMDETTKQQIERGLRLNEILKQTEHLNRSMALSLVLITLCTDAAFDTVETAQLRKLVNAFSAYLINEQGVLLEQFEFGQALSEEDKQELQDIFSEFYADYVEKQ